MKKFLSMVLAACMLFGAGAMAETAEEPSYTYNGSITTFPTNWNPHQYKTNTDNTAVLAYIADDLYTFDYNDTLDGYVIKPSMAVGEPEDVTADYVGDEWGIPEGATSRAWKYTLRQDLKWEDGTPITSADYVYSVMKQLNPQAQNYRADSFYSGSTVIHNAEAYAKSGMYAYSSLLDGDNLAYLAESDFTVGEDGNYTYNGGDVAVSLDNSNLWSSDSLNDYYGAGYFSEDIYNVLKNAEGSDGYIKVNADLVKTLEQLTAVLHGYESAEAYAVEAGDYAYQEWQEFVFIGKDNPEMSFDQVGVKALSDYEVVFILDKPLQGFQLKYNLAVTLVNKDLYEKCEKIENGVYTNNYGTSLETTISYGPYKLVSFQQDKEIVFEKNENWYGYALPENEGFYQTTRRVTTYVAEDSTKMEMFLSGKLDAVSLTKDYAEEYESSDYCYTFEGASVFAITLNPNLDALTANQKAAGENINKTILTVKEFRQALSFSLDRAAFNIACVPGSAPAFGLFGDTIVGDVEKGIFYRSTDAAKQVLVDFWGLSDEVGEGKLYATNDDAIDSITGYNLEMAREYFNKAYDIAIESGLMDDDDVVQIVIGLPSASSTTYNRGYEFLVNNYTEAVKGTKLEGKLTFSRDDTIGNGFGDALRNNQVDMLFLVAWSGSTFDPYSLMEAYLSPSYQYDRAVDYSSTPVTVELSMGKVTTDAVSWYEIINGTACTVTNEAGEESELVLPYSYDETVCADRLLVLAALENAMLQNYDFIPTTNDASLGLKGMKINYYTEEEIFPMSYGTDLKYVTYNYTDAEWDAFVAEQGGVLNYK